MELQTKECYSMDHHLFKLLFKKELTNDMPSKFGFHSKGRIFTRFLSFLWFLLLGLSFLSQVTPIDPVGGDTLHCNVQY